MRASVRCNSLTLGGWGSRTLEAQEAHGKREDGTSQRRRIRDAAPIVYQTLDLRAAYDRHMEGVRQNASCKRPVLHFIVKFPDEILTDAAPDNFRSLGLDERKALMAKQAVQFVNESHGESAVFAARVDRDEAGELVVDVFAAPVYEKITKTGKSSGLWASPTKFGKELAEKHQDEIQRRHPNAKGLLTGPRHVGIALQSEFANFFARENGVMLTRNLKADPRPDRLETEAFKAVAEAAAKVRGDAEDLEAERAALIRERAEAEAEMEVARREIRTLKDRLQGLIERVSAWLKRPDLTVSAREDGGRLIGEVGAGGQRGTPHGAKPKTTRAGHGPGF